MDCFLDFLIASYIRFICVTSATLPVFNKNLPVGVMLVISSLLKTLAISLLNQGRNSFCSITSIDGIIPASANVLSENISSMDSSCTGCVFSIF